METAFIGAHAMPALGVQDTDFGLPAAELLGAQGDTEGQDGDREPRDGPKAYAVSSNKPLTSKFRGVCWNKKNKRWQSAINSSGKYLYLGSYDAEEDAARVFDKAAVRIRYDKARLNFHFNDYVDEAGNILPDQQVEALLLEACNPTKPRRQRNKKGQNGQDGGGSEGGDGRGLGAAAAPPPPKTDATSAEIALQALARLCGPNGPGSANPDLSSGTAGGPSSSAAIVNGDGPANFQLNTMQPQPVPRLQLPPLPPTHGLGLGLGLGQGFGGNQQAMLGPSDGGMQLQALLEGGLGTLNAQTLSRTALLLGAGGAGGAGGLGPGGLGAGGLGSNSSPGGWDLFGSNVSATTAALAALQGQGLQGQALPGPGQQQGLAHLLGSMQRPIHGSLNGSSPLLRPLALGGTSDTGASSLGANLPPHLLQELGLAGPAQPTTGHGQAQPLRPGMFSLQGPVSLQGPGTGPAADFAGPSAPDRFPSQQLSMPATGAGASGAGPGSTSGAPALPRGDVFGSIKAQLPPGAELDSVIPTNANPDVLGVLYSLRDSNKCGAGIWTGHRFNDLGSYGSDRDAKQSINGALSFYCEAGQQQQQGRGQQQATAGRAGHGPVSGPGQGSTAAAAAAPVAPAGPGRDRDRGVLGGSALPGMAAAAGVPQVKPEATCIAPAGWQPDPLCDDPQGGVSEDESGTGVGVAGVKRRREGGDHAQGHAQGLGRNGSVGYGVDDPVLPDDDVDGRADKRQRGTGAGTTDLSTLQHLANIDVREALRMFFTGKQQG